MPGQGAIWLVGMMGAGKSTVGPVLAERLGRPFVDTDAEVARRAGKAVAEIFAHDGEAVFRELEAEVIGSAGEGGAVVALGGGAIAQPGAPGRLAARGTVVYLRARVETLLDRIGDPASRPLLAGLDEPQRLERIAALLAERAPAYASAPIAIDVDDWNEGAIVDEIASALEKIEAAAEQGEGV